MLEARRPSLEQVTRDHFAHREHVAVKMHGRFRRAGRARGERQQADIVTGSVDIVEGRSLPVHHCLQWPIPGAGSIADDVAQAAPDLGRLLQFFIETRVAQRMIDPRALGDHRQLLRTQQRHRRDGDGTGFHDRKPARHQHRIVRPAQQHAIARHDAEVVDENVGDAIGAIE